MVKIGDIELRGNLTLAPMAGVTDFAFRRVCRGLGAALTTTEMVSAKALVYKDEKTKALLYIPEDEHPCAGCGMQPVFLLLLLIPSGRNGWKALCRAR